MAITTLFLTGVEISARMYRGFVSDLFSEGIRSVPAGEYLVTARPGGANMTVQVAAGVAYIQGDDVTGQGVYRVENDALIIDVAVAAAPSSGTRTDLVCLRVQDKQASGSTANVGSIVVLTGQATLGASDKTLIALASVSVAAGQASVQTANITDLRSPSTGGGAAVRTAAETLTTTQIAALTTAQKYDGRLILNSTTGKLQRALGGAVAGVSGAATGTVTVAPTSVQSGTWVPMAYFIGAGLDEVQFTFDSAVGYGWGQFVATSSAARAQGITASTSGGGTTVFFAPNSSTDVVSMYTESAGASRVLLLRNIRIDSDGYLRFELSTSSVAHTTSSTLRFTWKAR